MNPEQSRLLSWANRLGAGLEDFVESSPEDIAMSFSDGTALCRVVAGIQRRFGYRTASDVSASEDVRHIDAVESATGSGDFVLKGTNIKPK